MEESEDYVKMVTRVTAGCQHMFKCLRVFRRTENILEIQEGSPTLYKLAACSPQNFDERLMIYTTLFKVSRSVYLIHLILKHRLKERVQKKFTDGGVPSDSSSVSIPRSLIPGGQYFLK